MKKKTKTKTKKQKYKNKKLENNARKKIIILHLSGFGTKKMMCL